MIEDAALRRDQVGTRYASSRFPNEFTSAGQARSFVSEVCRRWQIPGVIMDAQLVVTELVENAVRHGRTACDVALELTDADLTIVAHDGSRQQPRLMRPGPTRPGGRGLLLLENLCSNWGFELLKNGKRVWAMLPLRDSDLPRPIPVEPSNPVHDPLEPEQPMPPPVRRPDPVEPPRPPVEPEPLPPIPHRPM